MWVAAGQSITVKHQYQLPRIDDLLDQARGCRYFSALDMAGGYFQLAEASNFQISEADRHRTAFSTPWNHYEWTVLPMGLTNRVEWCKCARPTHEI